MTICQITQETIMRDLDKISTGPAIYLSPAKTYRINSEIAQNMTNFRRQLRKEAAQSLEYARTIFLNA